MTRTYVQESRDPNAHGIDWAGQVTLTAGLGLLVLALLRGNEDGWGSTAIVAELAGAAVALIAFVIAEMRVEQPMLPLKLFRDGSFTGAQITAFAISSSFFAIFLYVTLYLQQILGLSAIEAGLVYLPGTLVMLVVSGATAQLGTKVPARTMIAGGLALVAIGMGLFLLAGTESSWLILMPGFLVASVGTGLFNPALTNVALSSVPADQSGVAAGVNDTFRQAGIAVGVAALGALIPAQDAFGGDAGAYVSRHARRPARRRPVRRGRRHRRLVPHLRALRRGGRGARRRAHHAPSARPSARRSKPRKRGQPSRSATSLAIASEAVAAGDGALTTCSAWAVSANAKSSSSAPSRPTAWARTPAGPGLDVGEADLRARSGPARARAAAGCRRGRARARRSARSGARAARCRASAASRRGRRGARA